MEDNNFFGFVSKIGSLINNKKPKEKETKNNKINKKFNIKISQDDEDEKEIDDLENEEEEEDDEENNKFEEEIKKIKNEKDKIQNIVLDILNNNDKNEENNIKEEKKDEINDDNENDNNINNIDKSDDNINNESNSEINNNNLSKINPPSILNNSFPVLNNENNSNIINTAFFFDETSSCHIMLKKGNDININDYLIYPILFLERQKSLFYKMGMTNIASYEPKKYIFFLDEHFLYFAKDEIILEEMDDDIRRITKIVNLFDVKDFGVDNNNEQFVIKLTIKKGCKEEKIISFYIDQKYFSGFIKNFNLKLSIYGIDFFSTKTNS